MKWLLGIRKEKDAGLDSQKIDHFETGDAINEYFTSPSYYPEKPISRSGSLNTKSRTFYIQPADELKSSSTSTHVSRKRRKENNEVIVIKTFKAKDIPPYTKIKKEKNNPAIESLISESTYLKDLGNNWDGEGGISISEDLYNKVIIFLREYACFVALHGKTQIVVPEINPCKNGSIDLEWHTPNARMLINIRLVEGDYYAYFYGDKYNNKTSLKGNVLASDFSEPLAYWMKNLV